MNKKEFTDRIKTLVKQVYAKTKPAADGDSPKIDLDASTTVSLNSNRFPALNKFPSLYVVIVKLLTDQYELFMKEIEWVAPRPTTFRIILNNDQEFYLIYTDRTWIGKVEGKKYYLLNISEEQNCVESVARILSYGAKSIPSDETKPEVKKDSVAPETPIEEPISSEPEFDEPPLEEPAI